MARTGRPRSVFLNPESSYEDVHYLLFRDRGPAKGHPCSKCGGPAFEWGYLHNGEAVVDDQGRDFCRDLDAYSPVCRSCHRLMDEESHPGTLARNASTGHQTRREQGPTDRQQEAARANAVKAREAFEADPLRVEKTTAAGRLGGLARARKIRKTRE